MIDEKSLEILQILQEKARIPNVEVSRQVNLAPSAVLERIRKLEKQGIIDGYEVRLNPEQFSCGQVAFIQITIQPGFNTPDKIGDELAALHQVQEVHYTAGTDGYLIKVRTSGTAELGEFMKNTINQIKGIESTRTTTVLQTIKETSKIPIL